MQFTRRPASDGRRDAPDKAMRTALVAAPISAEAAGCADLFPLARMYRLS
jgi:hypothetical protein